MNWQFHLIHSNNVILNGNTISFTFNHKQWWPKCHLNSLWSKTQAQSLLWSSVNDYYNLRLFSSKSDFENWSLKVYKKINKLKTISLTTTTRNSLKILQSSSDCETQPPTWGKRAFAQFKLDLQQVSQCHRKNALELASNRALFKSIRLAVCQNT